MAHPETVQEHEIVPEWDKADRLRKALRMAGVKPGEMASYLDVEPHAISRWLSGRINSSQQSVRLWALRTGVPLEWLLTGAFVVLIAPGTTSPQPSMNFTSGGRR